MSDFKLIQEHRNRVTYLMNVARKRTHRLISDHGDNQEKLFRAGISYRVQKMNFASQIALTIPFFLMTSVHFRAEDL